MTRGQRIREAARSWIDAEPGRSVLQLCRRLGVSEPTYYNWVGDKTEDISADNLMKFAILTRFNPRWLMRGELPKMMADDARLDALLKEITDLHADDYDAALKHIALLKSARKSKD